MTPEMIENIARAIWDEFHPAEPWSDADRQRYMAAARAAIAEIGDSKIGDSLMRLALR